MCENVATSTNVVEATEIPDDPGAVGISAKIIPYEGAKGYVNNEV